jgi:hypothetical protein
MGKINVIFISSLSRYQKVSFSNCVDSYSCPSIHITPEYSEEESLSKMNGIIINCCMTWLLN